MIQNTQSLVLESGINFQHFPFQKANLIQPEVSERYPNITEDSTLQARNEQDRLHNKQNMNLQTL